MATAKKRKLDSISDGQAPSEPEEKRHHTTNRCRLTELPDELLVLIAEHLAGFDDPITYVHQMDGKLIIEHPKAYHDVSLAGLRDLSDTLCTEFEKALHRNGIITFEDQDAFVRYFNPDIFDSHPRMKNIRLATQRMRFNMWNVRLPTLTCLSMKLLINLKEVHLGGAWKDKNGPLHFTPTKANASYFKYQVANLLLALSYRGLKNATLHTTYGPGRFGRNNMMIDSGSGERCRSFWVFGDSKTGNHAAFDELLAVWNEDLHTLACNGSIVSMDEETLSMITNYVSSFPFLKEY